MRTHELKCWPTEFDAIARREKRFEVRSNTDRDFAVGDTLVLMKWDPERGFNGDYVYTSSRKYRRDIEQLRARVTYMLHGGRFGLPPGLCVMSIEVHP